MIFRLSRLLIGSEELNKNLIIKCLRHESLSRVFFLDFFRPRSLVVLQSKLKGG